ncbi:nitric oxide reductase activation protein NorD [Motiliproteus coralliicola]|uniref:Nitric oxide reductase activation protein NorD n=1 Tax=Motiliproteus coralliicola TaxID=2283196 RepID=A0A369WPE2_9GAMM|nr:nitric oxide reductase activation protein NorD [Motiliproteus coralliicola]RDE22484.1 nitric oxide reductase activation protein NorD [Motiliproteus coralliicola]
MEEFVGEIWHKLISRQANTDFANATVQLDPLQSQLATYYRALGGAPGVSIDGADERVIRTHRRFAQKLAGSHLRFAVAWQDDRSLRLPVKLAFFEDPELNLELYYWLTAMAARLPRMRHWLKDNQRATLELFEHRPKLQQAYQRLAEACIALRPDPSTLKDSLGERERLLQQAILQPGTVDELPGAKGAPNPIPLWIYPPPWQDLMVETEDDLDDQGEGGPQEQPTVEGSRKQAKRFDDSKQTDGLMVFKLEALFTWAESVDLDRPQEENLDEDLEGAAEDLDIITLSKKRRAGSSNIKFDLDLPAPQNDDLPLGDGMKLPEWDYRKQIMLDDYCLLQPMLNDEALPEPIPEELRAQAKILRHRFSQLRPNKTWQRKQPYGDEIDMDAWLEHLTQIQNTRQSPRHQNFYKHRNDPQRELACLLLSDLSLSTEANLNDDKKVIDMIRETMVLFAEALSGSGDPFAIYGFSSIKNKQVRYQMLKNFNEPYGDEARGRILAVKPGFYTRIGAAIRQSTEILKMQKAQQRLMLILSDGKPNDIDRYEGRYGIEDTRRAIQEAKMAGLQPFCVTIDEQGNDYLPYLFGDQGYAVINDVNRLPQMLPKLYLNLTGLAG